MMATRQLFFSSAFRRFEWKTGILERSRAASFTQPHAMNRFVSPAKVALLAAAVLSTPLCLSGADVNWKGDSSLNWSDPGNWDAPVPGSTDIVHFSDDLYTGYTNVA